MTVVVILCELHLDVYQDLHTNQWANGSVHAPVTVWAIGSWLAFCCVHILDNHHKHLYVTNWNSWQHLSESLKYIIRIFFSDTLSLL